MDPIVNNCILQVIETKSPLSTLRARSGENRYVPGVTEGPPERRSACPISFALDILGDRWTLLVVRDLVFAGKRNFQDFLASPEKIATNILANRLARLQQAGVVTRRRDASHVRRVDYSLTPKGLDLIPVLLELIRWGATHDPETAAPAAIVRRIEHDRDGFAAELRAAALARHTLASPR